MQYPDWNQFNYIYADKQQIAFEALCRNLFRFRYNLPASLGYFKNHAGNETDVISHGGDIIGFNAKFFEHNIDDKQIIHSIKKAHEYNPAQTKIIIYTNKEFGNPRGKKSKTKVQLKIEQAASDCNLKIEWMFGQNILDEVIQCELLYNIFFNTNDNTRYLFSDIIKHNNRILNIINTEACGKHINRIETQTIISHIQNNKNIILSGCAGIGKSAIFKTAYNLLIDTHSVVILSGSAFDVKNIDELLYMTHQHNLVSLKQFYQNSNHKLLVIDGIENIPNLNSNHVLQEFLNELHEDNWQFLFTIRDSSTQTFIDWLNRKLSIFNYEMINIAPLKWEEIQPIIANIQITQGQLDSIKNLLQIPFYLARFSEIMTPNGVVNEQNFKDCIWDIKICGKDRRTLDEQILRRQNINKIIEYCESNNTTYVPIDNLDASAIAQFIDDCILIFTDDTETVVTFSHDIYRDWAYENIICRDFTNQTLNDFLSHHSSSVSARFAFSSVIYKYADKNKKALINIINDVLDGKYPHEWEEHIFASILKSSYAIEFIKHYETKLNADDGKLLLRIIQILKTYCQYIKTYFEYNGKSYPIFMPEGEGWDAVITILKETNDEWYMANFACLCEFLETASKLPANKTDIHSYISQQLWRYFTIVAQLEHSVYISDKSEAIFHQLLCRYSYYLTQKFIEMIDKAPEMQEYSNDRSYLDLMEYMATTSNTLSRMVIAHSIPLSYIKLIDWYWTTPDKENRDYYHREHDFGLNLSHTDFVYFPCSGLQTPIKELLTVKPNETIQFIINFFNRCIDCYIKNQCHEKDQCFDAEFIDTDGISHKILASDSFWCMYRNTGNVMPDVLKSILMALENYLLDLCKTDIDIVHNYLKQILCQSNNCATIAVVSSVVMAYPDSFIDEALALFSSITFFLLDNQRYNHEYLSKYIIDKRYKNIYTERNNSNELPHRKLSLEKLCLLFQYARENSNDPIDTKKLTYLYNILDKYQSKYDSLSDTEKAHAPLGFLLARIDLRRVKRNTVSLNNGLIGVSLDPDLSDAQRCYSQQVYNEANNIFRYSSLTAWARFEYDGKNEKAELYPYHQSPLTAFHLMKELQDKIETKKLLAIGDAQVPAIVAAILLVKFIDALDENQTRDCIGILTKSMESPEVITDSLSEFDICMSAFPILANYATNRQKRKWLANLLLPFLHDTNYSCMNVRCCDTIGNIVHTDDFQTKHIDIIELLINQLVVKENDATIVITNEDIADALLCILPYPTPNNQKISLAKLCLSTIAQYFRIQQEYPSLVAKDELAYNAGHYIASSDIGYLPELLTIIKDSLNGDYISENFLTGLLFTTISQDHYDKWRLACEELLDTVARIERDNHFSKLTPLFMLCPPWIRQEFANDWYKFTIQDLERIKLFVSKVPKRNHILTYLLRIANTIGSAFQIQILPLISTFTTNNPAINAKDHLLTMEMLMHDIIKTPEIKNSNVYDNAVNILQFMINNGSVAANDMLKRIKR